ncbi:MAG: hypothetical protein HYV97_19130 [Bdellovibrio sp.]|nr:hypothetical protein [Bdellovibrio sp.]
MGKVLPFSQLEKTLEEGMQGNIFSSETIWKKWMGRNLQTLGQAPMLNIL